MRNAIGVDTEARGLSDKDLGARETLSAASRSVAQAQKSTVTKKAEPREGPTKARRDEAAVTQTMNDPDSREPTPESEKDLTAIGPR